MLRLCGEVLEDCLLGDTIPTNRSEYSGKGAGVAVRGNIKDVVEFLPGIPDLGEWCVPGDPGERECDKFLPAVRKGILENRKQILKFCCEKGGIPIFPDIPGRYGAIRNPRPFGNEPRFLRESAKVGTYFLWGFGSLILDTC